MTTATCLDPEHAAHDRPGDRPAHVETAGRLDAVAAALRAAGFTSHRAVPVAEASDAALAMVHTPEYVERAEALAAAGGGWLDEDTYCTPDSLRVARRGAGGLLAVVDAVAAGGADNGFALVRPPGHHALPDRAMGFCLLANAALAAEHLRQKHGAERVLVVDWDVHHGNGTEAIFYRDPGVLYFDLHQHPLWPGTGALTDTGEAPGAGFTVNVPLPPGADDAAALRFFQRLLFPLADRFRPDFVLVSAGFDAHRADPLGALAWTAPGFAELMTAALEVADRHCGGRLVATLEGGYDPGALAASVVACLRRMEDPCAPLLPETPPDEAPAAASVAAPDVAGLLADLRTLHRIG